MAASSRAGGPSFAAPCDPPAKYFGKIAPMSAAPSTTVGNGRLNTNSAAKAAAAMIQGTVPRSARRATRNSAWNTITSTAHFSPKNSAPMAGTSPSVTKMMESASITIAPGMMNSSPAMNPPTGPCSSQPR